MNGLQGVVVGWIAEKQRWERHLEQQAQKKRKIGFTITITAGSSSGLTWDASGCDVERAREIVMHDLLGKMPQHGEVRGVLGGKHGRKYMCLGSTGGSPRRSRARARASTRHYPRPHTT